MTQIAIRAEGLSKKYRIGRTRPGLKTFKEAVTDALVSPVRRVRTRLSGPSAAEQPDTIWALKDVGFEVKHGEVIGIIGGNGAGKSTLLKILSRITEPTTGTVDIQGRVGSLLEVGTGFHHELTGRENIYLNGAILGMRRREIADRFDEIVAFAEVDQFIDTPVKHYSTGMYLRLAFAVAAHLEPDILIVDEVLSVGDVEFQKKCLGKMQEVSRAEGRTVLFVSHNMDAVHRLCSRVLRLDSGGLIDDGDAMRVVRRYLATQAANASPDEWIDLASARRSGTGEVRIVAARYRRGDTAETCQPISNGPLDVSLRLNATGPRRVGSLAVTIYSLTGLRLVNADSISLGESLALTVGDNVVTIRIEQLHLNPGIYRVGFWIADPIMGTRGVYDYLESAFEMPVFTANVGGYGVTPESVVPCRFKLILEA
jgi:lipopolysaccharide transport system ATP-binding protein